MLGQILSFCMISKRKMVIKGVSDYSLDYHFFAFASIAILYLLAFYIFFELIIVLLFVAYTSFGRLLMMDPVLLLNS